MPPLSRFKGNMALWLLRPPSHLSFNIQRLEWIRSLWQCRGNALSNRFNEASFNASSLKQCVSVLTKAYWHGTVTVWKWFHSQGTYETTDQRLVTSHNFKKRRAAQLYLLGFWAWKGALWVGSGHLQEVINLAGDDVAMPLVDERSQEIRPSTAIGYRDPSPFGCLPDMFTCLDLELLHLCIFWWFQLPLPRMGCLKQGITFASQLRQDAGKHSTRADPCGKGFGTHHSHFLHHFFHLGHQNSHSFVGCPASQGAFQALGARAASHRRLLNLEVQVQNLLGRIVELSSIRTLCK